MTYYLTQLENFSCPDLPLFELERDIPEWDLNPENNTEQTRAYAKACETTLADRIPENISSQSLHRLRSLMIDNLIVKLWQNLFPKDLALQCAIVAVGGYGREEMSLYSDTDLLFLYDKNIEQKSFQTFQKGVETILALFWDAKLDVGASMRTVESALKLARKDHTIFTNLLDMRFLIGYRELFQNLKTKIQGALQKKTFRKKLLEQKITEREQRLKKYGDSVYLLKPNIKESDGALRDLHFLRWISAIHGDEPNFSGLLIAQGITEEEFKALDFALNFLSKIRNQLHLICRKKNDQLEFEHQTALAKIFKYEDSKEETLAVEKFMRDYYTIASQNRRICQKVINKIQNENAGVLDRFLKKIHTKSLDKNFKIAEKTVKTKDDRVFENEPANLMLVFKHLQKTGLKIHPETKELIGKNLYLVDKNFRENYQTCQIFREVMSHVENLGATLFSMHDLHFFEAFIPEFRHLRSRVQHDIYHVYTVDAHSIFAVSELSKLKTPEYRKKFPTFTKALDEIQKPDLLTLSLLFHDIGKGQKGNHSLLGAKMANTITRRLGYNETDQKMMEFLVLSHLMMSQLSQRRDLEDEHLIREFAKSIKSLDTLNMLFILTWADIRAVNPEAWTDWKGSLLEDLYKKTRAILTQEALSSSHSEEKISLLKKQISSYLKNRIDEEKLYGFLETVSPRYIKSNSDEEIIGHFYLIEEHKNEDFFIEVKNLLQTYSHELLIYAPNNPRVIALVTGVMLSFGINILAMEIFPFSKGDLFIKLNIQIPKSRSFEKEKFFQKVKGRFKGVFSGQKKISDLIASYKVPYSSKEKPVGSAKTQIAIDNDVSPYYTVIDIFTHDRLGLLYDITNCLSDSGYYVEISKISTDVEQVVDTFYVKDIFGKKITDQNKLHELKEKLLNIVEKTNLKGQVSLT